MELPNIEDIYDFDTPKLNSVNEYITQQLSSITDPKTLKKANKLLGYIHIEIQERKQTDETINFFIKHEEEQIKPTIDKKPKEIEEKPYQPTKSFTQNIIKNNEGQVKQSFTTTAKPLKKDITQIEVASTQPSNDDEAKSAMFHKPPKSKAQKKKIASKLYEKVNTKPPEKAAEPLVFTSGKPIFSNKSLIKKKKKTETQETSKTLSKRSSSISTEERSTISDYGKTNEQSNKRKGSNPKVNPKINNKPDNKKANVQSTAKKTRTTEIVNRKSKDIIEKHTNKEETDNSRAEKAKVSSNTRQNIEEPTKSIVNATHNTNDGKPPLIQMEKHSDDIIIQNTIKDNNTKEHVLSNNYEPISNAESNAETPQLSNAVPRIQPLICQKIEQSITTPQPSNQIIDSSQQSSIIIAQVISDNIQQNASKTEKPQNENKSTVICKSIVPNSQPDSIICSEMTTVQKNISNNTIVQEISKQPAHESDLHHNDIHFEEAFANKNTNECEISNIQDISKITINSSSQQIEEAANKKGNHSEGEESNEESKDSISKIKQSSNENYEQRIKQDADEIYNQLNQEGNQAKHTQNPIEDSEDHDEPEDKHAQNMKSQINKLMNKAQELDRIVENSKKNDKIISKNTTNAQDSIDSSHIKKEIEERRQRLQEISKQKEPAKKEEAKKKAVKPKEPKKEEIIDYSSDYKTFADIFSGVSIADKKIDYAMLLNETLNSYHAFNSIMDPQLLFKYKIEQAPIEKMANDIVVENTEMQTVKDTNEKELLDKNVVKERLLRAQQYKKSNEEDTLLFKVIRDHEEVYDIVTRAFNRKKRWNEMPHGLTLKNTWNLLWTWSKPNVDTHKLLRWQKVNHFPDIKYMSRKDQLKRHFDRVVKISKKAQAEFNIVPISFIVPKEYVNFVEEFSKSQSPDEVRKNIWIMKPCASSRGRGITVITSISEVVYTDPMIIQKYITNPLLLDGLKFDLRIYVLITSVNPLEAFLYRDGFARLSTEKFSIDPRDLKNKFVHLTNTSIQQHSENMPDSLNAIFGGTKLSLDSLRVKFHSIGIKFDDIWIQIQEIIVKTFVACMPDMEYNPCCFELLGFDIMIDELLKCWLIEVNSSPSLGRMNLLDDLVKQKLIDDTIDLINPLDYDRKRLEEVLLRRSKGKESILDKATTNKDIAYILHNQTERKYGELPKFMGNYERIAPSPILDRALRAVNKL